MIANEDTLAAVRRLVGTVPVAYGADVEAAETAKLVVSELVSNAVRACGDGTLLVVEACATTTCITVAVHDSRRDLLPTRRTAVSDDAECGRGLALFDVLNVDWTVEPSPLGKQVRCHVPAAQRCICGKPAERCTYAKPFPRGHAEAPSAFDWCSQRDDDPTLPSPGDGEELVSGHPGADMTTFALGVTQLVGVSL
ncbi:ATP-binding protein [Streptomyces botrytidirepellens]|nr:ATP-binding protein [Streptomyces botrytidirepellens]